MSDIRTMVPVARVEVSTIDDPECDIALAIFVAGCRRRCRGCQNPEFQDTRSYKFRPVSEVIGQVERLLAKSRGMIRSVVFVGGEWMLYPNAYVRLALWVRRSGLKTVLAGLRFIPWLRARG